MSERGAVGKKPRLSLSLKRRKSGNTSTPKKKRISKDQTIDLTQPFYQTKISNFFSPPWKNNGNGLNKTLKSSPQATGSCSNCFNSPSTPKSNDTELPPSQTSLIKVESKDDLNDDLGCIPLSYDKETEDIKFFSISTPPNSSFVAQNRLNQEKDGDKCEGSKPVSPTASSDYQVASTSMISYSQNVSPFDNFSYEGEVENTDVVRAESLIKSPLGSNSLHKSNVVNDSVQCTAVVNHIDGIPIKSTVKSTEELTPKKSPSPHETVGTPNKLTFKSTEELTPKKSPSPRVTVRTPSKLTVKSIEELTSKKSPSPLKEAKVTPKKAKLTPKKGLTISEVSQGAGDTEKITFSNKIKRRPGKFFDSKSMPESLMESTSKVQSPLKDSTPQKKKKIESNGDASQTKLDSFLTPPLKVTPEMWKKADELINNQEAMEKIRKKNAAKQLFPASSSKDNISEFSFIYYLLHNPMIKVAKNRDIINQDQSFVSMISEFEKLSFSCQQLYAKMFERTPTWYRVESDLVRRYQENMGDIKGSVAVLIRQKFLDTDLMKVDLLDLLKLLSVPELKTVFAHFNLEMRKGSSTKKGNLIEALLNHACSLTISSLSKSFLSSAPVSLSQKIKLRVIKELGECVCLSPEYRQMFNLLVVIATYPYHLDKENKRLSLLIERLNSLKFRKRTFPSYVFRPEIAFQNMKHLKDYAKALSLVGEYSNFCENKDWDSASNCVIEVKKEFLSFLQDEDNIILLSKIGGHLLKFTAGYQYCFCLTDGITVLKKNEQLIDETIDVIRVLLNQQQYYRRKRGIWYDELANIYQNKKKDLLAACEVVKEALNDESLDPIRKLLVKQRGSMLIKRKSKLITDAMRAELSALIPSKSFEPLHHTITANCHEGVAGRKQVFYKDVQDGKEYSSVEEIVIHHYKNSADPTYACGVHDEGRTLMNIILGCFYDVIYSHPEGDSMFHCQIQTHPLDWGGPHFYKRRQHLLNGVLDELRSGGVNKIMSRLETLTSLSEDVDSVINWDYIRPVKLPKIKDLLECLGINVFVNIAEHVIKNYKAYHSGFPDLILWDPPSLRCLLVEVKGPSDKLSITQTLWLENLKAFGANALVCHVESQGSRKRKLA